MKYKEYSNRKIKMKKCKHCGSEIVEQIGKTMKIPELKIEVEIEIHDKNKCLGDIKIPKGWRLLKVNEIIFLHNNLKYKKKLSLVDTWEFTEQPFELNKQKDYVARFYAISVRANLYCYGDPSDSIASLGVRFCKDFEEEEVVN